MTTTISTGIRPDSRIPTTRNTSPSTTTKRRLSSQHPRQFAHLGAIAPPVQPNGKPSLHQIQSAITQGDTRQLAHLLKDGVPVDTTLANGETLLQCAVRELQPDIVNLLLQNKASVNTFYPEPTTLNLSGIKLPVTTTPLMQVLLPGGPSTRTALDHALKGLFMPKQELETRLRIATALMTNHANANLGDENTSINPLWLAAELGEPSLIARLLECGAKPNQSFVYLFDGSVLTTVTPLTRAATNQTEKHSDIVALLLKAGENPDVLQKTPWDLNEVLATLSIKHPGMTDSLASRIIQTDHSLAREKRVNAFIKHYLTQPPRSEEARNKAVEKLLIPQVELWIKENNLQHYSHLSNWIGEAITSQADTVATQGVEGWYTHVFIPRKIKSMLATLTDIHKGKVDCIKQFNEPKNSVMTKLRAEIANQVNTFFTFNHQHMFSFFGAKTEQSATTLLASAKQEALHICDQINALKPGQTVAGFASFPGHAIYMEYKRQPDHNITRTIYNLGAGVEDFHSKANNGIDFYPSVVKNIPASIFKKRSDTAIQYILLPTRSVDDESYQSFMHLYANTLGGESVKYPTDCEPFPRQVSGNCSVHNNQAAIKNRLKNNALFDHLVSQEKKSARTGIKIPKAVEKNKTVQAQKNHLDSLARLNFRHTDRGEVELFKYLRSLPLKKQPDHQLKPGDRLAFALTHLKDRQALGQFMQSENLVRSLAAIAKLYQSKPLARLVDKYRIRL